VDEKLRAHKQAKRKIIIIIIINQHKFVKLQAVK